MVLLQKVLLEVFEELLFTNYDIALKEDEKAWFGGDGEELRGSIEGGRKGEDIHRRFFGLKIYLINIGG